MSECVCVCVMCVYPKKWQTTVFVVAAIASDAISIFVVSSHLAVATTTKNLRTTNENYKMKYETAAAAAV